MVEESTGTGVNRIARKAIPAERDSWQSALVVWAVSIGLVMMLGLKIFTVVGMSGPPPWFLWAAGVSTVFALLVWGLKAATGPASALGGVLCLCFLMQRITGDGWTMTGLPELIALFVITFAATRFGRGKKEAFGPAEARRGRRAAQIAANLGVAAIFAVWLDPIAFAASLAALAEATADTVSSEMGQVLGGRPFLVTTLERVEAGTDGGISLAGTLCGVLAAGVIAVFPVFLHAVSGLEGLVIFVAGCAGLIFDSVLGATLEQRGWIGNDVVNTASTLFAAWFAHGALGWLNPLLRFW